MNGYKSQIDTLNDSLAYHKNLIQKVKDRYDQKTMDHSTVSALNAITQTQYDHEVQMKND